MANTIRWLMAWSCYWVGHCVWKVGDMILGKHMPGGWYRIYSTCMVWSDYWQGDTTHGPWKAVEGDS